MRLDRDFHKRSFSSITNAFSIITGIDLKEKRLDSYIWSITILHILAAFYRDPKRQNISTFLLNSDYEALVDSWGINVQDNVKDFVNIISKNAKDLGVENWGLLSDPHPYRSNKFIDLDKNNVVSFCDYDYSNFLANLINNYFPIINHVFPIFQINGKVLTRKYLMNSKELTNPNEFLFLFGGMIAFSTILRMYDLNTDNMLIMNNKPIFFDLECLFLPRTAKHTVYDVNASGFLPSQRLNDDSLFSGGDRFSVGLLFPWLVDEMNPRVRWKTRYYKKSMSVPYFKGERLNIIKFRNDILKGYEFIHNIYKSQKIDINEYIQTKHFGTRVVLRPTRLYIYLMRLAEFKKTASTYRSKKDFYIHELKNLDTLVEIKSGKDNIIESEISSLLNFTVPVFNSYVKDPSIFAEGMEIGKLSESQIKTFQKYNKKDILSENRILIEKYLTA